MWHKHRFVPKGHFWYSHSRKKYFDTSASSFDTDNLQTPKWDFDIDPEITTAFDGLDDCFTKSDATDNFTDAEFPYFSTNPAENDQFALSSTEHFTVASDDQYPFLSHYQSSGVESYVTKETDWLMMKRSMEIFNFKAKKELSLLTILSNILVKLLIP